MSLSSHLPPIYPSKLAGGIDDDPAAWNRVSSWVSHADFATINSAAGQSGCLSFIIDHAIKSAAEYVRHNKLRPVLDTHLFLKYLRERQFDDVRQRSASEPPPLAEGSTSDDAGRATSPRQQLANSPHVATSPGSTTPSGLGGKGKGGKRARRGEG